MKFITAIILLLSVALCDAQQTTNTFFGSVETYFTSANTNYSWANNKIEAAVGADYMSGVNWAQFVKGQYDLQKWDIEGTFRNASVAGTIVSVEAGGGYTFVQYYSVKLQGALEGGYDLNQKCGIVEPGIIIRDKPTPNTFFGLHVTWPIWMAGKFNNVPDVGIETGFTY